MGEKFVPTTILPNPDPPPFSDSQYHSLWSCDQASVVISQRFPTTWLEPWSPNHWDMKCAFVAASQKALSPRGI